MSWRLTTVQHCNTFGGYADDGSVTCSGKLEDVPVLYELAEVLAIRNWSVGEIRDIHRAKALYSGQRIVQN